MENTNEMQLIFDSRSSNESFARVTVAAFMTSLNPTVEEVSDVKTAVSEAVTNAIIHGYESEVHNIYIRCRTEGKTLYLEIEDEGKGIEDVKQAMEPLFTTKPELERSGMGFSFMEAFMDKSTQSIAANKKVTIAELDGVKPLLITGADDDDDHHGHDHGAAEKGDGDHHHGIYNMHLWLSPEIARLSAVSVHYG